MEHVKTGCRLELWLALAMHRVLLPEDTVAEGRKGICKPSNLVVSG